MKYHKLPLLLMLIFFNFGIVLSQSFKLNSEKSKMSVSGTSSLHDWESNVESFSGSGLITIENSEIVEVSGLEVTVVAKSIKSGKSGMDKKIYEALKETDYPNIKYSISSISKKSSKTLTTSGNLTIAGKTKSVNMDVEYQLLSKNVSISGKITIKMSEYDIKPPTAMLGTIKTGDEITISYTVLFSKN